MTSLVVPARFNGPPHSGNGGWTCGALAALLTPGDGEAVQVRLLAPPPLDVPMSVSGDERDLELTDAGTPVARASVVPSPFTDRAPAAVGWDAALAAEPGYRGWHDHPFPTCFSCGTGRPASDGLGLRPGPLADAAEVTACTWTPAADVAEEGAEDGAEDGAATLPVTWAALDCPGGWSVDLAGRPMVLGTMTARVEALPRVGVRHVVMGRVLREEGRKAWTETALYALGGGPVDGLGAVDSGGAAAPEDADGAGAAAAPDDADGGGGAAAPLLIARATAVWIAVDPAAVRPL